MRVSVLGSGSRGNATLVEAGGVRLMIDAGFSGKDLARRLRAIDVEPESVTAIVITHDHGDHTCGMGIFARRFGTPIHLTQRTRAACARLLRGRETVHTYGTDREFLIGRLRIDPFLTVHDAADPVAVTLTDTETGSKLGIATDLGRPTTGVRHALARCHMLVLESNHDEDMLWSGPYPWSVKQRIASSHGHLSNRAAGQLATELFHGELASVVLAHLSDSCNEPALAHDVVGLSLEKTGYGGALQVAPQDDPTDPVDVEELRIRNGPEQLTLI